jgi:hypothetical protein
VYGTVRTVVWEDGGGDPASYPIGALGFSPCFGWIKEGEHVGYLFS